MTAFNDVLSVELKMLRDDEVLLLSLDLVADVEELDASVSCLVGFFGVVMAETSADERWSSCNRCNVVYAARSREQT